LFPVQYFRAVGIIDTDKGKIVGAAIFQNYTGTNVNLSYYGKNTLSAGIVRSLAKMAVEMGVARGTLITSKRNRRLIRSLLKLGFKVEGTQRCFYGYEDTARNTGVRLVMFRDDLKKLGGVPEEITEKKEI
jgi:RimJ/RimL family protein N-acetyltransferase